ETDVDPVLWRLHALALRTEATSPIDAPPPLGRRLDRLELERQLADRVEEAEPTIMKELHSAPVRVPAPTPVSDDDVLVFPGSKIPRLSDYVHVMKAMRGADPLGALAKLGIDMASYAQLTTQWGQRLAADPVLSARFTEKMTE